MKRLIILIAAGMILLTGAAAVEVEAVAYHSLAASILKPSSPLISGRMVAFTADGKARHVGIAFEHENFRQIHSFQRIIRRDMAGNPQKEADGSLRSQVLFWIGTIPPGLTELRYRLVIDGLWTTDPLNTNVFYDYTTGLSLSVLPVELDDEFTTVAAKTDGVTFRYEGRSGQTIRLAGTFNNWDPFMYEMTETVPNSGRYEISLPLPPGTWYYAFFDGMSQIADNSSETKVYTRDGRVASVIRVP